MDPPPGRLRPRRLRVAATVAPAAIVPFGWWGAILPSADWDMSFVQPAAGVSLLVGALIGLCSPTCCCGLAVPVGLVMLPAYFVLRAPWMTFGVSWLGVMTMMEAPL